MKYLIAVDLEGIHGVVGDRYETLTASKDYPLAVEGAVLEVNTAISALFDEGAELVAVWDNHGGIVNIPKDKIDERAVHINAKGERYRFDFAKNYGFDALLFIGYHSREGTKGGVLAHTYNSTAIQYARLDGKDIGELFVDSYIAASHGFLPIFVASDDKGVLEAKEIRSDIRSVITKYGKGRNCADLLPREEVLTAIYEEVRAAAKLNSPCELSLMQTATLEVRYTRCERAEDKLERARLENIPVSYGEDSHTLIFKITAANQIPLLL